MKKKLYEFEKNTRLSVRNIAKGGAVAALAATAILANYDSLEAIAQQANAINNTGDMLAIYEHLRPSVEAVASATTDVARIDAFKTLITSLSDWHTQIANAVPADVRGGITPDPDEVVARIFAMLR